MKMLILFTTAALLLSTTVFSQAGRKLNFKTVEKEIQPFDKVKENTVDVADINHNAAKHFKRVFKDLSNVQWFTIEKGYVAYAKKGETSKKIFYDNKGRYMKTISSFNGGQLPAEVRDLVKESYGDFTVEQGWEIESLQERSYVAQIENREQIKLLLIQDDVIAVIKEYTKSK